VSSGILFLPPYFVVREFAALEAPIGALFLQLIYQGVLVGILAALLFASAVQKIGSLSVAALSPTMPALATIIALFALGEVPSAPQWVGIALITGGLVLSRLRT
jgi:drug/metabolite transporter (DMT)-like permease